MKLWVVIASIISILANVSISVPAYHERDCGIGTAAYYEPDCGIGDAAYYELDCGIGDAAYYERITEDN